MRYSLQPALRFRKIAPALFLTALPIMWGAPALSQEIDPNIQERIESFQPEITSTESKEPVADVAVAPASVEFVKRRRPEAERVQELNAILEKNGDKKLEGFLASPASNQVLFKKYGIDEFETKKVFTPAVVKKQEAPPIRFELQAETKEAYETNATKSRLNEQGDAIFAISPVFLLEVTATSKDKFTLSASSTFVRYGELTQKSGDALNGTAIYRHVVTDANGILYVSSSFSTDSYYSAGFGEHQVNYYKPSITVGWEKIPLAASFCAASSSIPNCLLASLSVTSDRSWSSIDTQENATGGMTAGLTWATPFKDLRLSMLGSARFKHFTEFTGGRNDVILSSKFGFTQKLSDQLSLVGSASYTDQSSTLNTVEWDGFAASLALKVTVDPTKK